jgi:hypothetical protein
LDNLHVSQGGLTAAFRLVNQVMKKETIVNGLSVAAKAFLLLQQLLPLLTIKHKLTLFRMASGSATQLFPIGALKEVKER